MRYKQNNFDSNMAIKPKILKQEPTVKYVPPISVYEMLNDDDMPFGFSGYQNLPGKQQMT